MQKRASLLQAVGSTLVGVVIVWQCLVIVCRTMHCNVRKAFSNVVVQGVVHFKA